MIECTLPHEINLMEYHHFNVKCPHRLMGTLSPASGNLREVMGPSVDGTLMGVISQI